MRALFVVAVVALVACKSKSAPRVDECKAVTDHLTALQLDTTKNLPEAQRAKFVSVMTKIGEAVTANCHEMRWSAEVMSCLKTIKSLSEGEGCQAKMTAEQKSSVDKIVQDEQAKAVKELQGSAATGSAGSGAGQ